MVWVVSGSVTSAITRRVPTHSGQTEISISNTRLSRSAQLSGEKVLRSEQNMSGAIAERVLEFVAYLAGCVGRQPLQTDGGTRDVTTQTFKTLTLLRPAGNTFSEKPFLSTVKGFGWVSLR
jgi:hypothetical protein